MMEIINLGYNNVVLKNRVVAILGLNSSPLKRLVEIARKENKLIDATSGRKTRSIILTDTGFIILSSLQPQRLAQRIKEK
ncbi:MAG: DUF370 domain-containing protein [Candidatus Omnitrophota bacterium]|nr:MAG: DUF370 domain-containing protein [Candidatus Omnitrophota bacterium]